jgi:hypothetical protein
MEKQAISILPDMAANRMKLKLQLENREAIRFTNTPVSSETSGSGMVCSL